MKPLLICLAIVGSAFFPLSGQGSICGGNELSIDFTKQGDAASKATWPLPDKLTVTEQGLGWEARAPETIDGWIQTKPLAVGLSWRTVSSVSLRVTIAPAPKPFRLDNGQTVTPFVGKVYARFSPDTKHWSTWQALNIDNPFPKDPAGRLFTGTLGVPQRELREYHDLMEAYSKLDVPWTDDEEAMVGWIIARDAKYFERSLPFIGYVEFLFEAPLYGGQRITALKAYVGYAVSGFMSKPKDPNVAQNRDIPWRFKAQ